MVIASAAADTAIVLGAIGVLVASLTTSFVQLSGQRKIHTIVEDTQTQVTTINSKTAAQLLDATETRRIDALSPEERTAEDEAHLREVPDAERPASIADRVAHVEEVGVLTHDRVEQVAAAVNGNGNGDPPDERSLYELVQHLCAQFEGMAGRLQRLEDDILPPAGE